MEPPLHPACLLLLLTGKEDHHPLLRAFGALSFIPTDSSSYPDLSAAFFARGIGGTLGTLSIPGVLAS